MIRFKDDIAAARERVEAWWDNRETDRALIQVTSPRETPVFTVPAPTAADLHAFWTDPTVVIPRILNSLGATYFGGEAFPVLYPVPGRIVSITSKYLGAPNVYVDDNTTWSEPIITDWDDAPDLAWNPDNEWWRITLRNMRECAEMIERYELECFMGLPDLNGPTEVLASLRNAEKMCLDLLLAPDEVKEAARKVQDAWFTAWRGTTEIAHAFGGYFTWMGLWSSLPAPDLQSDFSCLISPEMFDEFILPFVREQAEAFPRSIFHLDGPDMVRHLDTLLSVDAINAVQWVQGAGAGPVSDWMEVMHRVQEGGKALYVYCEPWEVERLIKNLDRRGLMVVVRGVGDERMARELVRTAERLS